MEPASLSIGLRILLWIVPVYLAIVVHEIAHGLVASHFGDNTARDAGRLTLNPVKHIDPVGSLVVPAVLLLLTHFIFGWARPVPVNPAKLHRPNHDMLFVAAAGPLSNLLMSIVWAFILKTGLLLLSTQPNVGLVFIYLGAAGVVINAAIMMLNLLPLLPLDGGRILASLLPPQWRQRFARTEPWGFPILLIAVIAGVAGEIVWPLMVFAMAVSTELAQVPVKALMAALSVLLGQV
jgi:Zn-dependent protease